MTDRYDSAVVYLTAHPDEIPRLWDEYTELPAGCLFEPCGPWEVEKSRRCPFGCLTQIANGTSLAITPGLTAAIAADPYLPERPGDISPSNLPRLASWRRAVDAIQAQPTESLAEVMDRFGLNLDAGEASKPYRGDYRRGEEQNSNNRNGRIARVG